MKFETEIEKGKAIFSHKNTPKSIQDTVGILSHPEFLIQLKELIGINSLNPLTEFNSKNMPFNYFHRMSEGGFLGSHGVSKLEGNSYERSSIYMDYLTNKSNLKHLNIQSQKYGSKFIAKYWRHQTTFIPFKTMNFRYFYIYSKYLAKRLLCRF